MAKFVTGIISLGLMSCATFAAPLVDLDSAKNLEDSGNFKQATAALEQALKNDSASAGDRRKAQWEIDWMERVRQDYSFTQDSLFARLSKSLKNFSKDEFENWLKQGWFDGRMIDGEMRYVGTSVSNLFWRHPELEARRNGGKNHSNYHTTLLQDIRRIKQATVAAKSPYVVPTHFQCTMTVTAEANAAPNGEVIRAWLPVPRKYPYQTDFKLTGSSPEVKHLADETSPIRAAYLEQTAQSGQATTFQVKYDYTRSAVHFDLDPAKVSPLSPSDPAVGYTTPTRHVIFTDKIKNLAQQITGDEKNPLLQARAIYNWISENIKYSFAREYSTLTNISDYACSNRYGDCGQESLLFITLCRSKGIPARWQSGWNIFPGEKDIHDWSEIYLTGYGWVPVDAWAGVYSMHYCTNLSDSERREIRDFYFGGLDQYRMAANGDHCQELQPPKKNFRSDDVDFQRGELEAKDNIYFDKYSYELEVHEVR